MTNFRTRLAKALFATDPRVQAFCKVRAERPEALKMALRRAWDRNEGGWRYEAEKRIAEIGKMLRL